MQTPATVPRPCQRGAVSISWRTPELGGVRNQAGSSIYRRGRAASVPRILSSVASTFCGVDGRVVAGHRGAGSINRECTRRGRSALRKSGSWETASLRGGKEDREGGKQRDQANRCDFPR